MRIETDRISYYFLYILKEKIEKSQRTVKTGTKQILDLSRDGGCDKKK